MFDPKIYNANQYFQIKFCVFILILYLKLDNLNASPLNGRNKSGDAVEFILKPPDAITIDDSLMNNGDNIYSIENGASVKVESEVVVPTSKLYNYYSSGVDANSHNVTDANNADEQTSESSNSYDFVNEYLSQFSAKSVSACMLDGLKEYMMSWAYENGTLVNQSSAKLKWIKRYSGELTTLDASHRRNATDDSLAREMYQNRQLKEVVAFSAAFSGLTYVPYKTLSKMSTTLQYLMLKGNNFSSTRTEADMIKNEQGIAWATFPKLPVLLELDISNCMIEFVTSYAFHNLTNLTTLYLSHNKLLKISSQVFENVPNLRYLDLSHLTEAELEFPVLSAVEQIVNTLIGVKIEQFAFRDLAQLEYLDLSHTKVTRHSAVAFTFLGEKLKYLSLCFTALPMIGNTMFKNTALRGLDLSGNSYAAYSIVEDTFSSVASTLKFLLFEQSNLKDLDWIKILKRLVVLNLSSNNINNLQLKTFRALTQLQVLDLSSNHIGNWYNRVFTNNPDLKILNLRDNNINILTSEMLIDFQELDYLGIGDNNFVCDCVLRDLVDIAAANNNKADCVSNVFKSTQMLIQQSLSSWGSPNTVEDNRKKIPYSGFIAVIQKYVPMLRNSYQNIRNQMHRFDMYNLRVVTNYFKVLSSNSCPNTNQIVIYDKINGSTLHFQLLDYEDGHYWCFNETEKVNLFEMICDSKYFNDLITEEIRNITNRILIVASSVVLVALVIFLIYLKRWHIHYYYSSLKSAALLTAATQDNSELYKDLSESDSNLVYDLFISYCQSDREWVLDELIPNMEVAADMSICMHERDFQVGVTILDNIISCMERSRCLMLVISSNFLLSHWCQFEMRLAQHRMFEASREHIILVFLEDIPKRKRPKTLQYLMDVKTYIKWPSGVSSNTKSDEKKLFWKRLRRSLKHICWHGTQMF